MLGLTMWGMIGHTAPHRPSSIINRLCRECMAANGVGSLEVVFGMMSDTKHDEMLERKILPSSALWLLLDDNRVFQSDNAQWPCIKKVQNWCRTYQTERIFRSAAQYRVLNPYVRKCSWENVLATTHSNDINDNIFWYAFGLYFSFLYD